MKKITKYLLIVCISIPALPGLILSVQAQDRITEEVRIVLPENLITKTGSNYTSGDGSKIGNDGTSQYRTYYPVNLSSIANSGTNITIDEVEVHYETSAVGYTFRLKKITSLGSGAQSNWNVIGSGTNMATGIGYNNQGNSFTSTNLKNQFGYVITSGSPYIFLLGAMSEVEDSTDSDSDLSIVLDVTYTRDAVGFNMIARNDFHGNDGGNIGVGIDASPSTYSSPKSFNAYEEQTLKLAAYDGFSGFGSDWVFNNTEAPEEKSLWQWRKGQDTDDFGQSNQNPTYGELDEDDDGATFAAIHRAKYSITRNDYSPEFSNTFNSANVTVIEGNTLSAPSTQTDNGITYKFFEWSDGETENPRTIDSPTSSLTARYKAVHRSDDNEAFTNNSQRRLVQTEADGNVWLHQVYPSMGHVWLEHSDDGGATWTIGNDGKPLDGGAGGKNPSIAYAHHSTVSGLDLNYIGVVWQQPHSSTYKIMGKMFTQSSTGSQLPGHGTSPSTLHTEPSDSYSVDANPGLTLADFAFHPYLVTFERKSTSGSWSPGINWMVGQVVDQGTHVAGPFGDVEGEGVISGTNASSLHAQSSLVSSGQYEMGVNVIRQQGTGSSGKIYAHYISLIDIGAINNGSSDWEVSQYNYNNGNPISSGYSKSPSLVTLANSYFSACWQDGYDMVYYYLGNPSSHSYYGYFDVESCSINRGSGSNGNDGYVVFSQTSFGTSPDNISILFDEGVSQSSSWQTLSTSGKYIQLGNNVTGGTANMYVSAFKPTGSPYTFQTSSPMGPAPKQVTQEVVEGRGFNLNVGETTFRYRFGGLEVDGQYIRFAEAPDTAYYGKLETLNNALLTEPFQVKANSEIVFTERPGFADSAAAAKALAKGDYIRYKLELIDEATGQKVGTLREENVTASKFRNERSRAFAVNPAGLAGKTVRAKITLETNLVELKEAVPLPENFPAEIREAREGIRHSNLVLTKHYRKAGDGEAMDKSGLEELSTIEESPESFRLGQNYPNPFNPSTVISYQLPENSMVQLFVYDLLGRKVATLVNERQSTGSYKVTFDASHLASGVYLYRLQAGEFTESRKLFLVK